METNEGAGGPTARTENVSDLERYIREVRVIKQSLDEAEGSVHIIGWFYYAFAAVIAAATLLNYLVARGAEISMHDSLVFIWMPALFLGGVTETLAWMYKSAREKVPLFTPTFVKYMIAYSGVLAGLIVLSFFILRPDLPSPGIVLLIVGITLCLPVQYTHYGLTFGAFFLIAVGVLFVLIDGHKVAYFVADGVLVTAVFLISGIIETLISRRNHE